MPAPPPSAPTAPGLPPAADPWVLRCRGRVLDCRPGRVHVMGILNVTPDSFSDGGLHATLEAALARAEVMAAEGAAIIDIGGESTRPAGAAYGAGAQPVSAAEEMDRVLPVVEAVARALPQVLLSIDTYKADVAREALRAGAHLVNDVSGLREGIGTARAAAAFGAALVVMHARGRIGAAPGGASHPHEAPAHRAGRGGRAGTHDVLAEVADALARSVQAAEAAGVAHVVVDAGFGFGKAAAENLRLVAETDRLRARLGRPVLVGVSRKRTVGEVLGAPGAPAPVEARLFGSLGLAAVAALRGAAIVRVHDVRPTTELLATLRAAEAARVPGQALAQPCPPPAPGNPAATGQALGEVGA
ncbi:MAG: dihydropteroate synthase [Rubricoccaceae bacterium]